MQNLFLLCVVQQVPSIVLSPLAGWWIDRSGARRWLLHIGLTRCLLAGMLCLGPDPWVVFPAYFGFTLCSLFFHIGRLSLTPTVVPNGELFSFNALNERVSLAAGVAGPWIVGRLVRAAGPTAALLTAGFLFALTVHCVSALPESPTPSGAAASQRRAEAPWRQALSRLGHPFRNQPGLPFCFTVFALALAGGGMLNFGLPLLAREAMGVDVAGWGLILSGFQAGSCLSTFLVAACARNMEGRAVLSITFLLLAGAMGALNSVTSVVQMTLLMAVFGCGLTLVHVLLETLIQKASARNHLGNTMSLLAVSRGGVYLTTTLGGAALVHAWSAKIVAVPGLVFMLSAFFLTQWRRRLFRSAVASHAPPG